MERIDNSYGAFCQSFDVKGKNGLITIHPELQPSKFRIIPTGRYHIYGVHPELGTFTLILLKNKAGKWIAEMRPLFPNTEFIKWIGEKIEQQKAVNLNSVPVPFPIPRL